MGFKILAMAEQSVQTVVIESVPGDPQLMKLALHPDWILDRREDITGSLPRDTPRRYWFKRYTENRKLSKDDSELAREILALVQEQEKKDEH